MTSRKQVLDHLDLGIIAELSRNVGLTNKHLARHFKVSETTVANRIRSLYDRGVMRVTVQRDLHSMGYTVLGFAEIKVEAEHFRSACQKLCAFKDVISVSSTLGSPQIIIQFNARDNADAVRILNEQVGSVKGVIKITSHLVLQIVKFRSEFADLSAHVSN
jgi:Lrp/AsnC family leucine-responsive transcriptional regulator